MTSITDMNRKDQKSAPTSTKTVTTAGGVNNTDKLKLAYKRFNDRM